MGDKSVANLGEFGVIQHIFAPIQSKQGEGVQLGIGDDAACLVVPRTQDLLATTDTMVEGIHFSSDADPYLLGQKALAVNLSDIAAMGGLPRWYLLSMAVPNRTSQSWLEEFARGVKAASEMFHVALVGGDTVRSNAKIVITVQMLGLIGQHRAVARSGAQVGDRLYLSGTLGDSAFGLAHLLGKLPAMLADDVSYLSRRHHLPEPRIQLGMALQDAALAHACIDVSDGLLADLQHICEASQVSAVVDVEKLPFSESAQRVIAQYGRSALELALTGGEDYELLFAISPGAADQVEKIVHQVGVSLVEIGEVVGVGERPGVVVRQGGEVLSIAQSGWTHF
ncbi:thiamine-phosphate kinase [Magnetococcus marinus MC-1]|uniref:Thiamine-monophosphate kinase n=1 Tax=Magnetococcus marinus (strain ATCC BAA-1437 / JCM 17883 / MC-1) TaxID=156889 RepID=A0L3Z7_MAGMM|nr:thiamine-phosphate kinase [Magnetococcus marinus]ABK42690.1 thiamine-phosphate kinase [Magnetococcus marinus MC-1]